MPKFVKRTNNQTGEVFDAKVLTLNERNAKYVKELQTGVRHFVDVDGSIKPIVDKNGKNIELGKKQKSYRAGYMASNQASYASYRKKNPNYVRKTGK